MPKAGGAEGGQWEAHRGPWGHPPRAARCQPVQLCVRSPRSTALRPHLTPPKASKASCVRVTDRRGKRSRGMGGGRVLRLVPGGVPGRAGRAEPSSRNRNQQEERRGLATSGGCVLSLAPGSGGSSCLRSPCKSLGPLSVPTPTFQDGTKASAALAFGEHFQIPSSFVISLS